MYGYENMPNMAATANMPHVGAANAPYQPMMSCSYEAPAYGYCAPEYRPNNTFALIVVLFILLIIIGATIYGNKC
ncbi:hypothetical protein A9C19_09200 [Bacillus weihaiensis]|uniref:Sporulation protein YjcZ n=1 Tax=Bacillus weihaiensis TaxID=1547283 RepID=A0A1L3MRE9_9BACI|nr:YjcZ family sporulation protein [Bacillus weihaiensis]APH04911.1 hypothetical protein A9C19_09200 [Bacillus weihaiensis]